MKVIIAGSRDFTNYSFLVEICDKILKKVTEEIIIVSGTARGADTLALKYADQKGFKTEKYPADWDKYGKSAGHIRNAVMADVGDTLIAFWDGKSPGTKDMIQKMFLANKRFRVIIYEINFVRKIYSYKMFTENTYAEWLKEGI